MRLIRGLLRLVIILLLAALAAAAALVGVLTLTEYRPEEIEGLHISTAAKKDAVQAGDMLKVVSFNTGYAGLDRTQDFFMDGGTGVRPSSQAQVESNLAGIVSALNAQGAQIYLLQEVDEDSSRTYSVNQREYYRHGLSLNAAFAYNYRCAFVPYPWPPLGKVNSGLMTLTELNVAQATRESLPVPFSWPLRVANLKRCLLVERIPVEGTGKELVVINLHLEAYDDGEGKLAQTRQLMDILKTEYRNGNYVIAGGDFNQTFEGAKAYPAGEGMWTPGLLWKSDLPDGFRYVYDDSVPTCRSLDKPYTGDRRNSVFYVIDGFILSDNLKLNHVETVDLNFNHADHNPVMVQVTLMK